jgi:hypothetical protein
MREIMIDATTKLYRKYVIHVIIVIMTNIHKERL